MLIIVATLAGSNGAAAATPELIARGLAEPGPLLEEMRAEAERVLRDLLAPGRPRDQAPAGAPPRRGRAADLRQNGEAADDPPRHRGGMSTAVADARWAERARRARRGRAGRPDAADRASSSPARWRRSPSAGCWSAGRGERPSRRTPGKRQAALRRAAERAETALAGLERPLGALPARARAGARRGALVVRRAGHRRADGLGAGARRAPACASRRTASPRPTSSSPCSSVRSKGSRPRSGCGSRRPTARRSGPGSSTCARTCSAGAVEDLRALAA